MRKTNQPQLFINEMNGFKTVLSSEHRLFDFHIREIFKYKDLIFLFVKRDFISIYKQTILGPIWAIIQPLLTTIVYTIIFGNLAHLTTMDVPGEYYIPAFLFYMAGNICWSYFSSTLNATANTFLSNRGTMGKVYFPRLVSPIATALSRLISFLIQFCMLVCFWMYYFTNPNYSIQLSPMLLLIPICVVQMMILSTGCGIIISSVTTKYRDLTMLIGFGLQLWQYGSPIAYGLQLIPEKWMSLYLLNPVTSIIVTFRYAIFGFGYFNIFNYILSWGTTVIIFLIGLILFSKIERTFMDTI